jgi:hypothetical protein
LTPTVRYIIACLALLFCAHTPTVSAQTKDAQLWTAVALDWDFRQSWLAELELKYNHLLSGGPVWNQYAIKSSVEYYPNSSFDLFGGVYLISTRQSEAETTNEIRPLVGLRWNIIKPNKRVFMRAQARYEHRFFTSVSDSSQVNDSRIRARLDFFIPITQKSYSDDKNLYAMLFSEVFINFSNDINETYQNSFRQHIGLGYRFSFAWRVELEYVLQASKNSINGEDSNNYDNVIRITLKHYFTEKAK